MKKTIAILALTLSGFAFAGESYKCTAGAGYETLYLLRSSVAKSRAIECAKEKCFNNGRRECEVKAVTVNRLVLSSEIYYRATATVVGND